MPTDFPQGCFSRFACAIETTKPVLRERDEAAQSFIETLSPSAIWTAKKGRLFHNAVSDQEEAGKFFERAYPLEDLILEALYAFERGERVALICTPVSVPAEPAVVVPLASEAA